MPATWRVLREGATTTWRFPVTWRFASTWERASMGIKVLENEGREVRRLLERSKVERRCQIGAAKLELVSF